MESPKSEKKNKSQSKQSQIDELKKEVEYLKQEINEMKPKAIFAYQVTKRDEEDRRYKFRLSVSGEHGYLS